jgi:two-component system cell cycle sensor histidine kinase/response regulator CckA
VAEESPDRYRRLIEVALEGVLVIDAVGIATLANAAAADLFGTTVDEIVGKPVLEVLGPHLDEQALQAAARRMRERTHTADRYELSIRRPDGTERVLLISGTPLYHPDGSFDSSITMFYDITDRVTAEAALRRSEHRLQAMLDHLPAVLSTTDKNLVITSSAGAGLAELGVPADSTNGMSMLDMMEDGHDPDSVGARQLRAVLDGGQAAWESSWGGRNYLAYGRALRNGDGEIEGLITLGLDITERKRQEAQSARLEADLRQAQKMEAIGRLAGGVAHDFNNLLTAIGGYAEFLLSELPPEGQSREDALGIQAEVQRAAALTRQLLTFSRRQPLKRQRVDLTDVVQEMDRMLRRLIGADVELVVLPTSPHGAVFADRAQLEQVVVNLVVNARDAIPAGGKIILETSEIHIGEEMLDARLSLAPGRYVTLAVRDTGVGMDAETMSRIFEPFFTTKEAGHGTGLGLASVFGIVEQFGGRIAVYSELQRGTTVKVYLPRTDQPVEEAAESPARAGLRMRGSESILLVEDEEVLRVLIARTLRNRGYHVLEARYASEAFAILNEPGRVVDLVLSDVVMPGMSGVGFVERVRTEWPNVRAVLMSGFSDRSEARVVPEGTGVPFLEKPFSQDQLLTVVREAIDGLS